MQRIPLTPREDWQQKVESAGLTFHTLENGDPYWDESAAYQFTAAEIDTLEAAGNTLQEMCLAAAQHIIDQKRYAELDIPAEAIPAIEWAWNNEPPALYGRFDLSWAGAESGHAPKLLEYNADTPTSLLEAAVIQWNWVKEMDHNKELSAFGSLDQFNSIHEKLIAKWKDIDPFLSKPIYFAALDNPEDQLTVTYLRDTAEQAGLPTLQMYMEEIGWNDEQQAFLDPNEDHMFSIFKLYPWGPCFRKSSARTPSTPTRAPAGSSPYGRCFSPTKASCPSSGSSIPTTNSCWKPTSTAPAPWQTTSANLSCPAKARTSPSSATTPPSPPPEAPTTARRSIRPSHPKQSSPKKTAIDATPSSASG